MGVGNWARPQRPPPPPPPPLPKDQYPEPGAPRFTRVRPHFIPDPTPTIPPSSCRAICINRRSAVNGLQTTLNISFLPD